MPSPRQFAIPLIAVAALVLGACGSSGDKSSSASTTTPSTAAPAATTTPAAPAGASGTVELAADPSGALAFDRSTLTAKAGSVTIDLSNPSPVPHAIAVEGNGADEKGPTVSTGGHSTVTVDLKPGTYSFYCPVPGHEAAGMKGTLKVS
jgi:plastocyanin